MYLSATNTVNGFTGFTGQMDYLRGDALNQQVRAAASVSCEIFCSIAFKLLGLFYETKVNIWSLYEIIHICTVVLDESEEWSLQ